MLSTILGALLPMVVTFLLGLMAAWHHDFGPKEASILNRMVLLYAVPLALFAGTVTSSRAELSQDVPLVVALCVATIGFYVAIFLLSRVAFRMPMGISARVQPALVLSLRWLGYGNPTVSEAVLTTAIPAMPIVVMLALQYRVVQAEAASAVFLSVIGSVITMGIFIALTS